MTKIKWTEERCIISIREYIEKNGEITRNELDYLHIKWDICCGNHLKNIFGNLDNFALKANFKFKEAYNKHKKWNKKKILKNFNEIYNEIGPLEKSDLDWLSKKFDICPSGIIKKNFKNLDLFSKEIKINYVLKLDISNINYWNKYLLNQFIKKMYKKYGRLSINDLNWLSKKYKINFEKVIIKNFGSLNLFIKQSKINFEKNIIIPKEEIIKKFKNAVKKYGIFYKTRFEIYTGISEIIVIRVFGSFKNLSLESQILFHSRNISNKEIIKRFKYEIIKNGIFLKRDFVKKTHICNATINKKFGSLDKLAEAANVKFKCSHITKDEMIYIFKKQIKKYGRFKKRNFRDIMPFHHEIVKERFGSLDKLAEAADEKFLVGICGSLGTNETKILDDIEKEHNMILERQKWFQGLTGKNYFIDGFHKETNTIYEVDENHHKYQQLKDKIREDDIKANTSVNFIRINEQSYLKKFDKTIKTLNNFGVIE